MGGLCGVISGHPADTIRVRLQNNLATNNVHGDRQFKGFWDCARQTIVKERFGALYKGLLPPLIGETFNNCVLFGVYGYLKPFQEQFSRRNCTCHEGDYSVVKDLGSVAVSGAIAGASISVIVCPTELVKIQFQNNRSLVKETIWQCVRRCQLEKGKRFFSGAFHGFYSTVNREIAFGTSYFLFYELAKRSFARLQFGDGSMTEKLGLFPLLLSGGTAGTCAWAIAYPTDYVKSRVQADTSMNTRKVLGELFVSSSSWSSKMSGIRLAYTGFMPTVLRAFPVNAITFLTYEYVVAQLTRQPQNDNELL